MLLSANITKKDEHGGKVEERFAVLTNTKFCYYYYDSNYYENNEPFYAFYFKNKDTKRCPVILFYYISI